MPSLPSAKAGPVRSPERRTDENCASSGIPKFRLGLGLVLLLITLKTFILIALLLKVD